MNGIGTELLPCYETQVKAVEETVPVQQGKLLFYAIKVISV